MDDQNQVNDNFGSQGHDNNTVAGFGTPPNDPVQQPNPVPAEPAKATNDDSDSVVVSHTNDQSTVNDLLSIKQQALTQLVPLVDNLDQSPEDRFKTTMMIIQASDNQGLIKDAYEAAQQIEDEKAKAQALLDIVNEINYFSQHDN